MATEYTHLYYYSSVGNSDKEYIVVMEELPDGYYDVYALYGRRGNATNRARKVEGGSQSHALREYRKLITEKTRKGYRVFSTPNIPVRGGQSTVAMGPAQEVVRTHRKITL